MNEPTETMEQPMDQPVMATNVRTAAPYPQARTSASISPQGGCATCGATGGDADSSANGTGMPSYVYAIGRVEARFPSLAAE